MVKYWVVVVDDEAVSLANVKSLLKEQDMKVSCLRSGEELLEFMEKNTPDLIILDVIMPNMDGFETFEKLRQLEEREGRTKTPIVFLTGENDSETEYRGLDMGAADYIRKPVNKDILLSRIQNTLNNSKTIETLTEESITDKLTGFLNKQAGTEKIAAMCADNVGALMFMDIDNYKLVNDLYGHEKGDRMLEVFARILRENTRTDDTVCRIGGDEFLAFFCEVTEERAVAALSRRLNESVSREAEKILGENHGIPLGISIGVVITPLHGTEFETLFAMADNEMYNVKRNGKYGYSIYTPLEEEYDESGINLAEEVDRLCRIMEERTEVSGGLLLGQGAFAIVYKYVVRYNKRYGGDATLVLFSLAADNDPDADRLKTGEDQFVTILKNSLRRSDVVLRSRTNQFFVLLSESPESGARVVVDRVFAKWREAGFSDSIIISYEIKGM